MRSPLEAAALELSDRITHNGASELVFECSAGHRDDVDDRKLAVAKLQTAARDLRARLEPALAAECLDLANRFAATVSL